MGANSSSTPGVPAAQPRSLPSSTSSSSSGTVTPKTDLPKKRKNAAPVLNIMRRKRIRPTLIDDRVAIAFFRELRLTRLWINSGNLLAWALSPSDPDFINIHDYVERGQHRGYGVKIITILRIIPKVNSLAEDDTILDFNLNPKTAGKYRMMLWHGTKVPYVSSILQNGLKLPQHRGLFGAGIYFADRVSKSVAYCDYSRTGHGYLFLCDVLLDKVYEANSLFSSSPSKQSVKGMGNHIPDPGWNMKIDGCTWPLGRTIKTSGHPLDLNEYVVYNQTQVQPKYLIKFEYSYEPVTYKLY